MKVTLGERTLPRKCELLDVFSLRIKYMHGDADAYSDETFTFPPKAAVLERELELATAIKVAFVLAENYMGVQHLNRTKAVAAIVKLLPEEDAEQISTWYENFWQGDCTNDGQTAAAIDGIELRYFDNHGKEWCVPFDIDGKMLRAFRH